MSDQERFMSDQEMDQEIENSAPWGAEEKRLRAIRNKRRAQGACIMCGKPLWFFDKRAKREQHTECTKFIEDPA